MFVLDKVKLINGINPFKNRILPEKLPGMVALDKHVDKSIKLARSINGDLHYIDNKYKTLSDANEDLIPQFTQEAFDNAKEYIDGNRIKKLNPLERKYYKTLMSEWTPEEKLQFAALSSHDLLPGLLQNIKNSGINTTDDLKKRYAALESQTPKNIENPEYLSLAMDAITQCPDKQSVKDIILDFLCKLSPIKPQFYKKKVNRKELQEDLVALIDTTEKRAVLKKKAIVGSTNIDQKIQAPKFLSILDKQKRYWGR